MALTVGPVSRVTVNGRTVAEAPLTDDELVAKWRGLNPGIDSPRELLA